MHTRRNWISHPTRNEALLVFCVWLVSILLSATAASDFFTVNPLTKLNIATSSINLVATGVTVVAVVNYFRKRER